MFRPESSQQRQVVGILIYIKRMTHSLVHDYIINIDKILMQQFKLVLRKPISKKHVIAYPRFFYAYYYFTLNMINLDDIDTLHKHTKSQFWNSSLYHSVHDGPSVYEAMHEKFRIFFLVMRVELTYSILIHTHSLLCM